MCLSLRKLIIKLISAILFLVSGMSFYPALAAESETLTADVSRGGKAWAENCVRCHNARVPSEFSDEQWKPIVYHMRIRAGLTGQETRDILKFLQSTN